MSDIKKQTSLVSALTICVAFVALLSFFLPLYSIEFFATYSYSGFEAVTEAIDDPEFPELGFAICFLCSIASILFSIAAYNHSKNGAGTIIFAAIGMVMMIVSMSDDSDFLKAIDYADIGFYLFEIMSFVAILLSAVTMYLSKNEDAKPVPAPAPKPDPIPAPLPRPRPTVSTSICPKCKAKIEQDAAYCRFCGTALKKVPEIKPDRTERPSRNNWHMPDNL